MSRVSEARPRARIIPGDGGQTGRLSGRISVAICEEHEIISAGLVAVLSEDRTLSVSAASADGVAVEQPDVAVVSSRFAREVRFPCPIVVCCDEPAGHNGGFVENDVAGVLHRQSTTVLQLRATVHAAAAGLRIELPCAVNSAPALDTRALRVLELLADGRSTREIATAMSYSERTIKKQITELEELLEARTRAQTVAQAIRRGLI